MMVLVLTSFGTEEEARQVSVRVVEEGLAACATRLPAAQSVYRWQGKIEEAPETLLLCKVPGPLLPQFLGRLRELHSYETPEIIWWEADGASEDYQRWAWESCHVPNPSSP